MASPHADVKAAGSGKVTGGAKKPANKGAAHAAALAKIALTRRIGSGAGAALVMPHPSASLGLSLPVTNAGTPGPMPAPGPRIPVKGHTRAMPGTKG